MKKRLLAPLLALALLLTGCGIVPAPTDPTTAGTLPTTVPDESPVTPTLDYSFFEEEPTVPDSEMTYRCQYLPETVENPDDLPVLKWVYLRAAPSMQVWTEDAVHELNGMLADRNMPFRIQFILFTYTGPKSVDGGLTWPDVDWFARPEAQAALADADLITAAVPKDMLADYFMPVTEYVTGNAQPSLKKAVPHALNWLNVTVNGEIYGVNGLAAYPQSTGWLVDTGFMEKYGLTAADFSKDYWEMDQLFAEIYEKNGNEPFLHVGDRDDYSGVIYSDGRLETMFPSSMYSQILGLYQNIGAFFAIDPSSGEPTVINALETAVARNTHAAVVRYKKAGYCVSASGHSFSGDKKSYTAKVLYYSGFGEEAYTAVSRGESKRYIPVSDAYYDPNATYLNGVAAVSRNQEEAVALLSLIAEDEAFRDQLLYGKEGRDYTVADGVCSPVRHGDGSQYSMSFLSLYGSCSDLSDNNYPAYEGMTKLESYTGMLDDVGIIHYPIAFDYSGLEAELEAIADVCNRYFGWLTYEGVAYEPEFTEADYDQMLSQIRDAGSEKIIAELQRQLDEWLAANPDWLAQYG